MHVNVEHQTPMFWVRDVPIYRDIMHAPMDGFTDFPTRQIFKAAGSGMSYTEFINAIDVVQNNPTLPERLIFSEFERPVVYQLFDNEPERILKTAFILAEHTPDIIDINLGCSVRRVANRGAGAGLLREPQRIAEIFRLLTRSLSIPVIAKIRLGWDENSKNYKQVARILEDNGASLIAVHGRTSKQKYEGLANWDAIAEVKSCVSIPVIGNGDVQTVRDIEKMKTHTGCDGVMIGRAAIGNPWILSRIDINEVSTAIIRKVIVTHLDQMISFYGAERGLVLFRKHAKQYLKHVETDSQKKRMLLTCASKKMFLETLNQVLVLEG